MEVRKTRDILIVGCGSLGSYLARELARSPTFCKAGYTLVDPDVVEEKNLRNQVYERHHLGQPKVVALEKILQRGGCDIYQEKIETIPGSSFLLGRDMVVVAVDNMATRRNAFHQFKWQAVPRCLLVDLRGSGRQLSLYFIRRDREKDLEFYEQTLYGDEDVQLPGCDAEITQRNALICAALSIDALYNIINEIPYSREVIFDAKQMQMVLGKGID